MTTASKNAKTPKRSRSEPNESQTSKTKKSFGCTWKGCDRLFTQSSNMKVHVRLVHQKIKDVKCIWNGCNQLFTKKQHMKSHVKTAHQNIKNVQCTWDACEQMFTTKQHMETHVKAVHEQIRDVQCIWPGCDQLFTQTVHMQGHVKAVHQQIKSVQCTWTGCDKTFADKGYMQKHVKTVHQQIKVVQCTWTGCDKTFADKGHMRIHVKAVHEKIKDVKCTWPGCVQMFTQIANMEKHVKAVHEQIKDVECAWTNCSQKFTQISQMQSHVKAVHQQIKDVKCISLDCDESFSRVDHMQSHFQTWHTGKKQACDICKHIHLLRVARHPTKDGNMCHGCYIRSPYATRQQRAKISLEMHFIASMELQCIDRDNGYIWTEPTSWDCAVLPGLAYKPDLMWVFDEQNQVFGTVGACKLNEHLVRRVIILEVLEVGIQQHSAARSVSDETREKDIRSIFAVPVDFVYIVVAAYNHPRAHPDDRFFAKGCASDSIDDKDPEYNVVPSRKQAWKERVEKALEALEVAYDRAGGNTVFIGS